MTTPGCTSTKRPADQVADDARDTEAHQDCAQPDAAEADLVLEQRGDVRVDRELAKDDHGRGRRDRPQAAGAEDAAQRDPGVPLLRGQLREQGAQCERHEQAEERRRPPWPPAIRG